LRLSRNRRRRSSSSRSNRRSRVRPSTAASEAAYPHALGSVPRSARQRAAGPSSPATQTAATTTAASLTSLTPSSHANGKGGLAISANTAVPAYESLLYTVFQQLRQSATEGEAHAPARGLAVAFTSANSGEGVTHTIAALLSGLGRDPASRTLLVDSRYLSVLAVELSDLAGLCSPLPTRRYGDNDASLFELSPPERYSGPHSWEGSWQYRRDVLDHLRTLFDYILIDTPALRQSNDILSLAPFADGIILVVEADRTRKDQILHAEKSIEFARGKLIGSILNKRTYVVPEWIYRRL